MVVGVLMLVLQRLIFFSLFPFSHKLSIRFRNANGVVVLLEQEKSEDVVVVVVVMCSAASTLALLG